MKRNWLVLIILALLLVGCGKPKDNPPTKPLISQTDLWASLQGTWTSDDDDVFVDFNYQDQTMVLSIGLWGTEAARVNGTITNFSNLSQYEAKFTVMFPAVPADEMHEEWLAVDAEITVDYQQHPTSIKIKLPSKVAFGHASAEYIQFTKGEQINWNQPPLPSITVGELWNKLEGTWYTEGQSVVMLDFRTDGDNNPLLAVALYQTSQGRINGIVSEEVEVLDQKIVKFKVNFPAVIAIGDQQAKSAYEGEVTVDFGLLPAKIKVKLPTALSFDQLSLNFEEFVKGETMIIGQPEYNPYDLFNLVQGTWYSGGKSSIFVDFRFDGDNMPKVASGLSGTTGRTDGRVADFEQLSSTKMRLYLYFPEVEAQGDNPAQSSLEVSIEVDYANHPNSLKILLPNDLCKCSTTSNDSYTKGKQVNVGY